MARIRSLHPGQWTDERFVECSAFARLLTLGLRNEADDQGVFEWKPTTLKMRLFPADNVDVAALLSELIATEQVVKFDVGGKCFGAIRNFRKWQRPEKPKAVHPLPDNLRKFVYLSPIEAKEQDEPTQEIADQSPTDRRPIADQSPNPTSEEGGRREEVRSIQPIRSDNSEPLLVALSATDERETHKPEDPDDRRKRGRRIAPDWQPSDRDRDFARDEGLDEREIDRAAAEFRDYWTAAPGRNACKLDWSATWRGRIRQIAERRFAGRSAPARQERRGVVEIAAELAAEYAAKAVPR